MVHNMASAAAVLNIDQTSCSTGPDALRQGGF